MWPLGPNALRTQLSPMSFTNCVILGSQMTTFWNFTLLVIFGVSKNLAAIFFRITAAGSEE
jgi:hypothetical protein